MLQGAGRDPGQRGEAGPSCLVSGREPRRSGPTAGPQLQWDGGFCRWSADGVGGTGLTSRADSLIRDAEKTSVPLGSSQAKCVALSGHCPLATGVLWPSPILEGGPNQEVWVTLPLRLRPGVLGSPEKPGGQLLLNPDKGGGHMALHCPGADPPCSPGGSAPGLCP